MGNKESGVVILNTDKYTVNGIEVEGSILSGIFYKLIKSYDELRITKYISMFVVNNVYDIDED